VDGGWTSAAAFVPYSDTPFKFVVVIVQLWSRWEIGVKKGVNKNYEYYY